MSPRTRYWWVNQNQTYKHEVAPGPALFGALIGQGERELIVLGYLFGAALMVFGGWFAWKHATAAERKSLEHVAEPICVAR